MSQTPTTEQELWITLRLKGSLDVHADEQQAARDLLAQIQQQIKNPATTILDRALRLLHLRKPIDHGFTICQPGDVMDIETEAEIYDLEPHEDPANKNTNPSYTVTLDRVGRYEILVRAPSSDDAIDRATSALESGSATITFRDDEITAVDVKEKAGAA